MLAVLLDIVAPAHCAGCGAAGDELCETCHAEIARLRPVVTTLDGDLETLTAAGLHKGVLRRAIMAFKYGNRRWLAPLLAETLAKHLAIEASIIVPVPLHAARERERGYNQAELLARELVLTLEGAGACMVAHALRRVRATLAQSTLNAVARKRNVAHAFAAGAEIAMVDGKRVMLIDDVFTTGATLQACARVLRDSGARSVDAACIALRC